MKILSRYLANLADRRLVSNFLARRDEPSFRELYHRHTPALYQLVLRLAGWNVHEAEEIVQDTWMRAIEALDGFRWESSLRTWLSGIAINRCRELYRQRARQSHEVMVEQLAQETSITENFERLDLEQAIAALPNGYRQVLVLHDVEGYTHEEISRMLEIEVGTSKSQLARARSSVREALQVVATKSANRRI
ncbi:RNA polymerase sigma factor [candidate division KSB1 bacterium]|nr:RNA polymerase sigma factor [candidate division KSB1 bacterium]